MQHLKEITFSHYHSAVGVSKRKHEGIHRAVHGMVVKIKLAFHNNYEVAVASRVNASILIIANL